MLEDNILNTTSPIETDARLGKRAIPTPLSHQIGVGAITGLNAVTTKHVPDSVIHE